MAAFSLRTYEWIYVNHTFGPLVDNTKEARRTFFDILFGGGRAEGYVCLAYKDLGSDKMRQEFWHYPTDFDEMLESINKTKNKLTHAYYCPQLLKSPRRSKDNIISCTNAWADLDSCNPDLLLAKPSILTMTSPNRYQALWVFHEAIEPHEAENISMRIAYYHAAHGADQSGWDLTQLLRIPYTPNYKYGNDNTAPIVTIINDNPKIYLPQELEIYPTVNAIKFVKETMPEIAYEDPNNILQRFRPVLNQNAITLFNEVPNSGESWSEFSWKLINFCNEAGMTREETFLVVWDAGCNKYKRDGRPKSDLWNEINRAYVKHLEITRAIPNLETALPELLSPEEIRIAQGTETFIERYMNWAASATDASNQYHQAGAFTLLSAIVSGSVRLETSFGNVVPNLWFMIVGPTTVTRKSVSMDLAMELLFEIDPEIMFATDGSMEGITTGLKTRDGKASVFHRDEFTGLLQSMTTKDYMKDMPEHLTKLYDSKPMKRILRKEEIILRRPIFLILAGGIKNKIQSLLTEEHIASGFIPRFVFITAEADLSRIRPVGPKVEKDDSEREAIKAELAGIYAHYNQQITMTKDGKVIGTQDIVIPCGLTHKAWTRYNKFESTMIESAVSTGLDYMIPIYDRLCKSGLKSAMLIAASRQRLDKVIVEEVDILKAIYFVKFWRGYANEIVSGIGLSSDERLIEDILTHAKNSPNGLTKSEIMNYWRLSSKKANEIFDTMQQRQLLYGITYRGQRTFFVSKRG